MNGGRKWVAIAGLPILMVGLVVAFVLITEPAERVVRSGATGAARRNPLLAAERLIAGFGRQVESRPEIEPLPGVDQVLLLGVEDRFVPVRTAERIEDWVRAGGHLIVGPFLREGRLVDASFEDPLLARFGIGVTGIEHESADGPRAVEVVYLDDGPSRNVRQYADFALIDYDGDDEDEVVYAHLERSFGEGRVDVVNDPLFMHNDEIGDLDHALFLRDLVEAHRPQAPVRIVYGVQTQNLAAIVLRAAPLVVVAAAVWIAAFVWRRAPRFGPALADRDPQARSLLEHVRATGRFLWRFRRDDVLLQSARDAVLRTAALRRPRFASASRDEQARLLARGTPLSPRQIDDALHRGSPHRRDLFTRWMQTLETVRRGL